MAYLDRVDTILRKSNSDVYIKQRWYIKSGLTRYLNGYRDLKVISKGDLVEVSKLDWEMYLLTKSSKSDFLYSARKCQNKKSHKFYSLYFLEDASK